MVQVNLQEENLKSMEFPEIRTGTYKVLIQSVSQDIDKKISAPYLKVKLQVLEGEYANQLIFENFKGLIPNTDGAFGEQTKFSQSRIKSLMQALGLKSLPDTDMLINQQVMVNVKLKDGYTNVQSYSAIPAAGAMTNSQNNTHSGGAQDNNQQQQGGGW